jgi:hypothetical protein
MTRDTYQAVRRYCRCSRRTLRYLRTHAHQTLQNDPAFHRCKIAEYGAWLNLPLHLRTVMHNPLETS